jgi:hypothetical protein
MAKYKFPVPDVTYHEGYTRVVVVAGLADINENDPLQIAIARKHGGVAVETKRPQRRGKK